MLHAEQLPLPEFTVASRTPVVAALLYKDPGRNPKLLINFRLENGHITFPGGGLEENERPSQGLVREIYEETGIKFRRRSLIPSHVNPLSVALNGEEMSMYLFVGSTREYPWRREFNNHHRWRYAPARALPMFAVGGLMHPKIVDAALTTLTERKILAKGLSSKFISWVIRDRQIEQEFREQSYHPLAYIHDREEGHLVY